MLTHCKMKENAYATTHQHYGRKGDDEHILDDYIGIMAARLNTNSLTSFITDSKCIMTSHLFAAVDAFLEQLVIGHNL